MASANGHSEIVKMLIEGGADVNIQEEVREGIWDVCLSFWSFIFLNFNVSCVTQFWHWLLFLENESVLKC